MSENERLSTTNTQEMRPVTYFNTSDTPQTVSERPAKEPRSLIGGGSGSFGDAPSTQSSSNVDLIGAASVLSAKLGLALTCAATIYHKVAAIEPDATLWVAKHPEIQPLISIAITFGKQVVASLETTAEGLVPDARLIIALLKQLHAQAGSALLRRGGLE